MTLSNRRKLGFTLVEMSIVIVVIGLVLGGIVTGKSMIRSARVRSLIDNEQQYVQAISAFKDKYLALPGDFSGATALWGTTGGASTSGTGTQTWDGDGNGRITTQGTVGTYYEQFRAWQHLANAGMIDGFYSGVSASGANTENRIVGTNIPAAQLIGAGWGITTILITDTATTINIDLPYNTGDIQPNTVLWYGGNSITGSTNTQSPVLDPTEALQIDQKIDDGLAVTGKVVAQKNPSGTACYVNATGAYDTSQTGLNCALVFKTGF